MKLLYSIFCFLIRKLYRLKVIGLENYQQAGDRILIVANHVSFLDALIISTSIPGRLTFAVNTYVAKSWILRKMSSMVTLFPMDPANPFSSKSLINYIKTDQKAVIFPEGRITVTGSLMKVYDGTGFIADKSDAMVLPVRIDGAQFTYFSRLKGLLRLKWFPKITVNILPPVKIKPPEGFKGRERRQYAGKKITEIMTNMMFQTSDINRTLYQAFLDAAKTHGKKHEIIEDVQRKPLSYHKLTLGSLVLGNKIAKLSEHKQAVGIFLPNMNSTVATFLGLQLYGRVPAMLNFSVGTNAMLSCVETAKIKLIISSRRFIKMAKLEAAVEELEKQAKIVYLEDIAETISVLDKVAAVFKCRFANWFSKKYNPNANPNDPATILFTSGSEGTPKGVVLSHRNLLANQEQLSANVDFSSHDIILNVLPMFHSFGLSAATLLPLFSGIKIFFYPSPLHYRIIPELAYEVNATILFGTNTFLAGYAKYAHPYDFYSVRYVFAGAEKLQEANRKIWSEKFGVRIFEGYGATETSPVLCVNTPMYSKNGSVGRFLPGIKYKLESVPGVEKGGQLHVSGPNVMLGYYLNDNPAQLIEPLKKDGLSWYDTGDIVSIDDEGYVTIEGRVKRFAKVAGEMISLALVEDIAQNAWPENNHAAVSIPSEQKGETVVLVTDKQDPQRADLQQAAKKRQIGDLNVPRQILQIESIPLLGTGKIDYQDLQKIAEEQINQTTDKSKKSIA